MRVHIENHRVRGGWVCKTVVRQDGRVEERELQKFLGRTVALRTSYGERVGRLSLEARDGAIFYAVAGVQFVGEIVSAIRSSAILPMVVLG